MLKYVILQHKFIEATKEIIEKQIKAHWNLTQQPKTNDRSWDVVDDKMTDGWTKILQCHV